MDSRSTMVFLYLSFNPPLFFCSLTGLFCLPFLAIDAYVYFLTLLDLDKNTMLESISSNRWYSHCSLLQRLPLKLFSSLYTCSMPVMRG